LRRSLVLGVDWIPSSIRLDPRLAFALAVSLTLGLAVLGGPGVARAISLKVVAATGEPAPGAPGWTLTDFYHPTLNDRGEVAFTGWRSDGGTNLLSLWGPDAQGDLQVLFNAGDPAPGAPPGAVFYSLSTRVLLNDSGQIAFYGRLAVGPGGVTVDDDVGIWGPDGLGGTTLLFREGDPIPGDTGVLSEYFDLTDLSANGHVIIKVDVRTPAGTDFSDEVLLRHTPGVGVQRLLRVGDEMPGIPGSEVFGIFGYSPGWGDVDPAGRYVGYVWLAVGPGGVTASTSDVIAEFAPDGAVRALIRSGDPVPSLPGATFGYTSQTVEGDGGGAIGTSAAIEFDLGYGPVTELVGLGRLAPDEPLRVHRPASVAPGIPGDIPLVRRAAPLATWAKRHAYFADLDQSHPAVDADDFRAIYVEQIGAPPRLIERTDLGMGALKANVWGDVSWFYQEKPPGGSAYVTTSIGIGRFDTASVERVELGDSVSIGPGDTRPIISLSNANVDPYARITDRREVLIVGVVDAPRADVILVGRLPVPAALPVPVGSVLATSTLIGMLLSVGFAATARRAA